MEGIEGMMMDFGVEIRDIRIVEEMIGMGIVIGERDLVVIGIMEIEIGMKWF